MSLRQLNGDQIALLEEYKSSNLSILEFANTKGISKNTIYYLVDKERRLKAESMSLEIEALNDFIPVPIKTDTPSKNNVQSKVISFKLNGLVIQISNANLKLFLEAFSHD